MSASTEILLQCQRFYVERLQSVFEDGVQIKEVVRHPGSVVILPLLDDSGHADRTARVCLIRNFRVAVNQPLIELPAGTRESGESPETTARRELIEETGFHAKQMHKLLSFFAAPGVLDEEMHLFRATGLTAGEAHREPGEQIENVIATRDEVREMLLSGAIRDAKTLVGLMYWLMPLASDGR